MIELSSDFRSLAAKVYTFSFLCLAAKVLRISSISEAGIRIEFVNTGLVAGALAAVTVLLTLAAALKLLSDWVRTRLADEVSPDDLAGLAPAELAARPGRSVYETHLELIKWAAFVSFVIEALVPLAIGFATTWYSAHDVVQLLEAITT